MTQAEIDDGRPLPAKRHYDDTLFRVWPEGTVQCAEDGEPYSHMSDDYEIVAARDEDEARAVTQRGYGA